jgi:sulfur transfer complex TusBCD TusB component (DsrH family)
VKILHIIKKTNDTYARQTVSRQRKKKGNRVSILLLHDAVFNPVYDDTEVFACRDNAVARGVKTKVSLVGYEEIVKMLLDADSIVCW